MKRRAASLILIICMALALLPGTALAAPEGEAPFTVWSDEELPEDRSAPEAGDFTGDTAEELPEDIQEGEEQDDPIPEFVPGIVEEDEELCYPDYGLLGDVLGEDLPARYDSRGITQTAVKSQGSNGLCWTFTALAAMEAQIMKLGRGEQDLSELHMAYSTSNRGGNTLGYDREPYDGGDRNGAATYLMRGTDFSGAVDEASDPYIRETIGQRELDITRIKEKTWQAQNILFLTGSVEGEKSFTLIKRAIQAYGGVGAGIFWQGQTTATDGSAQQPFYNDVNHAYCYQWAKDTSAKKPNSVTSANHGVLIAGWDDNYPRENFNEISRPEKNGAWLIKNSWGKDWGDGGYAWVSYEDSNFPQRAYCFDGVLPYDPGEIVYETDYFQSNIIGYGTATERWYAKMFVKETDGEEKLTAVRIFLGSPYTSIQVGCVSQVSGETLDEYPFTSLEGGGATGETFCPGWYTVRLDHPISVTGEKGSRFAVAVRITAPDKDQGGSGISIGFDNRTTLDGGLLVFGSHNGKSWGPGTKNYCIKAVTSPVDPQVRGQVIVDKAAGSLKWALIRGENESQTAVRTDLTLPGSFKGADVLWTSSDPGVIGTDGAVTRPGAERDAPVTLTAILSAGGARREVPFDLAAVCILPEDTRAVNETADALTWNAIRGENTDPNNVTQNLTLAPSGTLDSGVTVTWTSSDAAAVGTDGTVTGPRFDKSSSLTLTAAVRKGEAERTVTFALTVPNREATDQDYFDAAKEWILADYDRWWELVRGENTDGGQIRSNLVIPETVTIPTETGAPFTIRLDSEAHARRKEGDQLVPWGVVSNTGEVTRPAYGEPDSRGLFYLRLPKGNGSYTSIGNTWYITVLAYRGAIKPAPLADVTAPAEREAVLEAKASTVGTPGRLQYQWYRSDGAGGFVPLEGETSARLRIPAGVSEARYFCEISALDAAAVRTNAARVTMNPGFPAAYADSGRPGRVETYNLPLSRAAAVYAARYEEGRMTGIVKAGSVGEDEVIFNADVGRGWKLFCLDGGSAPLCPAPVIQ